MIAPNGNKSNLTPEQYKLVRTPEFKAWFGDWENYPETSSKVVDKNGEPLVVYHSSNKEFNKFEKAKISENFDYSFGFHFSNDIDDSKEYGQITKSFFLKIINPFVFNVNDNTNGSVFIDNNRYHAINEIVKSRKTQKEIDGVIAYSLTNGYVTMYDTQIKLADGSNKTFYINSPDIRYKQGGTINKINNQEDFKKLFIDNGFSENDVYEISKTGYFKYIEFFDKETILVYRTLQLPSKIADEFVQLKHQNIGEYWTLNKNFISAIWGDGQYEGEDNFNIICTGHLKIKDIDWEMMKYAFKDDFHNFTDEYEVRGKNGGDTIKVVKCTYEENMSKGGRTIAQTPAPKSDRLKGSKVNKQGSATSECSSSIELSDKTINTLKGKLEEFKKGNPKNTTVTLDDLKAVYRRGSGAYSTSHRPTITGGSPNSRAAWSFARVNKFLKKASGEKVKAAYVQDDDLFKYEQGGLIAPNGKESNLTAEQYKLVRTPEFKAWFGDWENSPETSSKVVDENGEPLVMYSGSPNQFTIFKSDEILLGKDDKEFKPRFWFTIDKEYADSLSAKTFGTPSIYICFLNIRNPKYDDFNLYVDEFYDGSIQYNRKNINVVTAINSNQIKLADGTNTTFDNTNPDIRYKEGGKTFNDKELLARWKKGESIGFTAIAHLKAKGLIPRADGDKKVSDKYMKQGGGIGLIAPNGKQSNLTPEQYKLVRTPEFKAWFGDWENSPENASKVVDENGEPLVVFHRSKKIFYLFDAEKQLNGWLGKGFYFSESKFEFKYYGNKLLNVFINVRNPFKVKGESPADFLYELKKIYNAADKFDTTEILKDNNYDGVIYKHWDYEGKMFSCFEPNQIKIADGTNNTFDNSNPDIRFKKGGLIAPNGKQSNLTPEEYKLVRTPEFKAWFGDWENSPETSSKVIDANGEPLVMWHYAKRLQYELDKFYTFRVDKQLGSHFGTLKQSQKLKYSPFGESEVKKSNKELSDFRYYKVFLNIKNPIRLIDVGIFDTNTLTDAIGNKNVDWEYLNDIDRKSTESFADRTKYVSKTNGYDGAVYLNRYESDANSSLVSLLDDASDKVFKNKVPSAEDSWIAFYPNQIKLADGTNTNFNSETPDIRYEEGGYLNEEAQQYVDIISMDANNPKYSKYKEILKTKFGIDYDLDYANHDENIIDNADLEDLKGISDFLSYDKYVKYAYKIFRKRGFIENQPKHIEGVVSIDLAKKVGSYLGFSVELKEYFGTGNYAANIGDIIFMPNPVDINAFIHEIGHYFDHNYSKEYDGKAKDSLYATSLYEIRKSDEVFAENFMTYFIAPEWLLINMPIVFYELDNKIPQLYKDTINDLIKKVNNSNTSIKYADGGKVKDSLFNELDYVEKHIGYAKTPSQILYLSSKLSGASEQHRQLDGNDRLEFYKKRNELREKIESIKK